MADVTEYRTCLIVYDYWAARRHGAFGRVLDLLVGMRYGARSAQYPHGYVVAYGRTAKGALAKARRRQARNRAYQASLAACPNPVEVLRDCDG